MAFVVILIILVKPNCNYLSFVDFIVFIAQESRPLNLPFLYHLSWLKMRFTNSVENGLKIQAAFTVTLNKRVKIEAAFTVTLKKGKNSGCFHCHTN